MKRNSFSDLATKQELLTTKQELKDEIIALETRIDIKMEKLEQKIDDKARIYRDEVLTVLDSLLHQMKTMVEEQVIINKRNERTLARIENHETRITKLEKIQYN